MVTAAFERNKVITKVFGGCRDTDWGESNKASKIIIKSRNGNYLKTICTNNNFDLLFRRPFLPVLETHISIINDCDQNSFLGKSLRDLL